jgi:hypothetical protein
MKRTRRQLARWIAGCAAAAALVALSAAALPVRADELADEQRARLLEEMRTLAGQTVVAYASGMAKPELVAKPVFRYDDQPRRILDATLWMWSDNGRPVAFEKIEAIDRGSPRWSHCFTSFSTELLSVEWPENHRLQASEAGLVHRPIPDAPPVAQRSAERKRQMRELARQFSARIVLENTGSAQMRLLTTPIFEFSEPMTEFVQGAVFGFGTNGTNPDLLLAIEVRQNTDNNSPAWHFAPARITTNGIRLRYQDLPVWETQQVNYKEAPFSNWTCFGTPRTSPKEQP